MNVEVCAVIVTYYPSSDFERVAEILRPQVGRLVVIDNHSPEETVGTLRTLASKIDFCLIENTDNFGIGTALNQSIEWARRYSDCEFILFFDQDSLPSDTFVSEMVAEYRRHPKNERVFLVMPKIIHRVTGITYEHYSLKGQYLVAQTSGSLLPMHVFSDEGLYREDFFIDYVDYEFCLRAVAHGWKIVYAPAAVLVHNPGRANELSILGIRNLTITNHSPLRRYYLMRNGIWTIRAYAARYPGWALDHTWQMAKEVVRVLVFEQNRAKTLGMWFRAIRDVLRSRFGRYQDALTARTV